MRETSIIIMVIGYLEENLLGNIQLQLGTVFHPLRVTVAGTIPLPKRPTTLRGISTGPWNL